MTERFIALKGDPFEELRDPEPGNWTAVERADYRGRTHVPAPTGEALETPEPGTVFWVAKSGVMMLFGTPGGHVEEVVARRGDTFVLTQETIELSRDRSGRPGWPSLIRDIPRQLERWGAQVFFEGEPPRDLDRVDRTSAAEIDAERARRLEAAQRLADPGERLAAGRAIREDLGAAGRSTTLRGER